MFQCRCLSGEEVLSMELTQVLCAILCCANKALFKITDPFMGSWLFYFLTYLYLTYTFKEHPASANAMLLHASYPGWVKQAPPGSYKITSVLWKHQPSWLQIAILCNNQMYKVKITMSFLWHYLMMSNRMCCKKRRHSKLYLQPSWYRGHRISHTSVKEQFPLQSVSLIYDYPEESILNVMLLCNSLNRL